MLYAELWLWVLWFCLFGLIVFSVNNVLTLGAFGCSLFVINLCELSQPFSSDLFQYCCWLFTDVYYFSCAKCTHHSGLLFMWFSYIKAYASITHTSYLGSFLRCFFMHVLFLASSLSLDQFIIFSVSKVLTLGAFDCSSFVINLCKISQSFSIGWFQYCCWLFTDADYFSYGKCSYHSGLIFIWKFPYAVAIKFHQKVSLSSGPKVSLKSFP